MRKPRFVTMLLALVGLAAQGIASGAPAYVTGGFDVRQGNLRVLRTPPGSATVCVLQIGALAIASGSTSGTVFGSNMATGYAGNFLDFQVNGTSVFKIDKNGSVTASSSTSTFQTVTVTGAAAASDATGSPNNAATVLSVTGGAGGAETGASAAGVGAPVTTTGGVGGATSGSGTTGGAGGAWTGTAGAGGTSSAATSTAGAGGAWSGTAGAGGASSGTTAATGGAGGAWSGTAGAGGIPTGTATNTGGNGGAWSGTAGAGAAPTAGTTNNGGTGGAVTLTSGVGATVGTGAAGASGAVTISTANGGTATTGAGGNAASIAVTAGNGGNGSTAGGSGGNITLTAGTVGTGGIGSYGFTRVKSAALDYGAQAPTYSLLALGSGTIAAGSGYGNYLGINPSSFNGNFAEFEVAGAQKFTVSSAGATNAVRTYASLGTATATSDWGASVGSITSVGTGSDDARGEVKWTAAGTTSPVTLTFTFHNGTFTSVPFAVVSLNDTDTSIASTNLQLSCHCTATTLVVVITGTLALNNTVGINYIVIG